MTHIRGGRVGSAHYTGPGRTRPVPRVEDRRVGPRSLGLSSVGAGTDVGLVPGARPHGCPGAARSQNLPRRHLLDGEETTKEAEMDALRHELIAQISSNRRRAA